MPLRFPTVPRFWTDSEEEIRKLADGVNRLLRGESNNTTTVTLRANQATTEILDSRITADTVVLLTPTTSSAAAATGIFIKAAIGKATVNHDSTADTDRTFGVILVG